MKRFSFPSLTGRYTKKQSTVEILPMCSDRDEEFPLKNYSFEELFPPTRKSLERSVSDEDLLYRKIISLCCSTTSDNQISFDQIVSQCSLPRFVNKLDDIQGASSLHYAAIKGNIQAIDNLVKNGAQVDIWDRNNKVTPLMCAAANGHVTVVKLLLDKGADVNNGLDDSTSALLWATRKGHFNVVKCLLEEYNASQNSAVIYSETPIHASVIGGFPEILEILIDFKGNTNLHMGLLKNSSLHLASSGEYPNSLQSCKILLEKGYAEINRPNSKGQMPIHQAALSFDPEILSLLIDMGASVDAEDNEGRTPLFNLVHDDPDALKCLKILIEKGKCNVNHQDKEGYIGLHFAAFKESAGAVEILLENGADFSIKTTEGGISALSILLRKIPNTPQILHQVLDKCVKVSEHEHCADTKVKVNYTDVVPSSFGWGSPEYRQSLELDGRFRKVPISNMSKDYSSRDIFPIGTFGDNRKETSKLKCLVDENQDALLLHPVIHSFLSLKWEKAKPIFILSCVYKVILAALFSLYAQMPFWVGTGTQTFGWKCNETHGNHSKDGHSPEIWIMLTVYAIIIIMVVLNLILVFLQLLHSPKVCITSLETWIFATVLVVVVCMNPKARGCLNEPIERSIVATGVCVVWVNAWFNMGRFPDFGLSIRVFFKVLHDFTIFLLPHFCLFIGFILSFTLLFPESREFGNLLFAISKTVRIMAGDDNSPTDTALEENKMKKTHEDTFAFFLMTYIYTAYVLTVGIVLMNLLIGLAVHDIKGIYTEASMHRLKKQTILLHTLESNFTGKRVRQMLPQRLISSYITLFPPNSQSKILVFKPYDMRDTKLCPVLKKALMNVDSSSSKLSVERKNTMKQNASKNKGVALTKSNCGPEEAILRLEQKVDDLIRKISQTLDLLN